DDDSLPPYPVLDAVLKMMLEPESLATDEREEAAGVVAALEATPEGRALVARVRSLVARSEYKRFQAPPVIQVRGGVFGTGRRMPIAAVHNQAIPDSPSAHARAARHRSRAIGGVFPWGRGRSGRQSPHALRSPAGEPRRKEQSCRTCRPIRSCRARGRPETSSPSKRSRSTRSSSSWRRFTSSITS